MTPEDAEAIKRLVTPSPPTGGTGESPAACRMVVPPPIDPAKLIEQLNQIAQTISRHRIHIFTIERLNVIDDLILEIAKTALIVANVASKTALEQ